MGSWQGALLGLLPELGGGPSSDALCPSTVLSIPDTLPAESPSAPASVRPHPAREEDQGSPVVVTVVIVAVLVAQSCLAL